MRENALRLSTSQKRGRALLVLRIALGAMLLIALVPWIMSRGDSVFWFKSIHTQVRFRNGLVEWYSRWQYWRYDPSRITFAAAVLLGVSLFHRQLRTLTGVGILTMMVNMFSCGSAESEFAPPAAVLFDVLLLIQICRSVAKTRIPTPGICHICGYDLRATPSRCPECGTNVFVILKR